MAPRAADSTVLAGARVVLPTGTVEDGRLAVEGARIAAAAPEDARTVDLTGHWVVPGFVDMHNHGGGGASFTSGTADEVLTGIRTHREHGTTTMVASTVTGEMDFLARRAGELSELVEQGDLAGIHFEGPFISPCRKGAHSEQLLRYPDPAEVRKLVDAARGAARMVTLATELPGGLDSVRLLAELGVIAAIGHTDATYAQTVEAIDAGATVATHLFNAMPPIAHREPGPITALLEDDRITVELINDGTHLHPAVLELAYRHKGAGRVALITDAMDAAGFGDGSTSSARSRSRSATGSPGWWRAVRSPAPPSPWTPRSAGRSRSTGSPSRTSSGPSPPTRPGCSAWTTASARSNRARTPTWSSSTRTSSSRASCGGASGSWSRRPPEAWRARNEAMAVGPRHLGRPPSL